MVKELAALDMQVLKALSSSGHSTTSVLLDSTRASSLDVAAASSGGAGLKLGSGGGGGAVGGIGGLSGSSAGTGSSPSHPKGPSGRVALGSIQVSGGAVANATSVSAGMSPGFRRCYNRGLQTDPTMSGSVQLEAAIGPNGEVQSVVPKDAKGLSTGVLACVTARVSAAQFAPPDGGSAKITVAVTFTPAP
jgi:hypothetical protein